MQTLPTMLLVDATYLCRRAQYTPGRGTLSYQGVMTGVAFGLLADLDELINRFRPGLTVLAFDYPGRGLRKDLLPSYKSSRELRKSDEDKALDKLYYEQVNRLKYQLLPEMGYRNIVEVKGFEADDIVAHYAALIPDHGDAVIVSSDHDLWQCIRSNVVCYNPTRKEIMNVATFKEQFEVGPERWAEIKALAGCSTDDVPGVDGIGEKTAAKWFAGKMKPSKPKKGIASVGQFEKITQNLHLIEQNLPLVRLPFQGLIVPELKPDELSEARRISVNEQLGIRPARVGGPADEPYDPIGMGDAPEFLF